MLLSGPLVLYATALFLQWESTSAIRLVGCFKDEGQRLLPYYSILGPKMTINECIDVCRQSRYRFAGPGHSNWCFCGHSYPHYSKKADESKCTCRGNKTEVCGSIFYLAVYDLHETDGIEDFLPFVGCFNTLPSEKTISNLLKPVDCLLSCKFDSYKYAGTRGTTCLCSNKAPAPIQEKATTPKLCQNKMPVYFAQDGVNLKKYMGCYKIKDQSWPTEALEFIEDQTCPELCRSKGLRYAGSENNHKCFCSNKRPTYKIMVPDLHCLNVCETSAFEFCSDAGHARVYDLAVGYPFDSALKEIGCYLEKINKVIDDYEILIAENTPEKCVGLCFHHGYKYAGISQGSACRCGHMLIQEADPGTCNTLCPGDYQQNCGGIDSIKIYDTDRERKRDDPSVMGVLDS